MNPYGRPLVTLTAWNATLARCEGCCEMPICLEPSTEYQSIRRGGCGFTAKSDDVGGSGNPYLDRLYSKRRFELSASENQTIESEPTYLYSRTTSWIIEQEVVFSEAGACETRVNEYSEDDTIRFRQSGTGDYEDTNERRLLPDGTASYRFIHVDFLDSENNTDETIYGSVAGFPEVDFYAVESGDVTYTLNYSSGSGEDIIYSGSSTWSYERLTAEWLTAQLDAVDWEDANGTQPQATMEQFGGNPEQPYYAQKSRVRFKVNPEHTGTWFEFVFDIIEEPEGWDAMIDDPEWVDPDPEAEPPNTPPQIPDPDAPARSFADADVTLFWEVAAGEIPLVDDPDVTPPDPLPPGWAHPQVRDPESDSWFTEWYEIEPPTEIGIRRVVNIRYRCYRGPYGSLPQLMGPQVPKLRAEQDGEPIVAPVDLGFANITSP